MFRKFLPPSFVTRRLLPAATYTAPSGDAPITRTWVLSHPCALILTALHVRPLSSERNSIGCSMPSLCSGPSESHTSDGAQGLT